MAQEDYKRELTDKEWEKGIDEMIESWLGGKIDHERVNQMYEEYLRKKYNGAPPPYQKETDK